MSLREQILGADDLVREEVPCPEWGLPTGVYVRCLTGAERDSFEGESLELKDKSYRERARNLRARLVVLAAVDAEGEQIFTRGDVEQLGDKSARPLERLFEKARELSGFSADDVDELAKNSPGDPADASPSG